MTTNGDRQSTTADRGRAPFQWLALIIGVAYLLVGIIGFFVTGFDGFFEHEDGQAVLGFDVNPLHNIVHLVVGLAGVLLWSTRSRARVYGWLLAAGYGLTSIYGLIVVGNPDANILNINAADNWLHIISTVLGLVIALWPSKDRARA